MDEPKESLSSFETLPKNLDNFDPKEKMSILVVISRMKLFLDRERPSTPEQRMSTNFTSESLNFTEKYLTY